MAVFGSICSVVDLVPGQADDDSMGFSSLQENIQRQHQTLVLGNSPAPLKYSSLK